MVCLCTSCDEGVATLGQDLHQVVSQVATGQIQTHDGVGQSITLIDGNVVGHTITGVQHNTFSEQKGTIVSQLCMHVKARVGS